MVQNRTDVLIFVEDPGAANFIMPLPEALAERDISVTLLSRGIACDYLLREGVKTLTVHHSLTPDQIIDVFMPRLLVVGTTENPDTLGLKLIEAISSKGVASVGIVDAFMNLENRFRGGSDSPINYTPDWILVSDEFTMIELIKLGFSSEMIFVSGNPHYDNVLKVAKDLNREDRNILRRRVLPDVPLNRKVVVFLTEGSIRVSKQVPPEHLTEYTFIGRERSNGRTEIILEEFLDAIKMISPCPYLVLRLHPKDRLADYITYVDEFDYISSGGSPLELLYIADLVVGTTSMSIMEAALMGRPTLSIIPRVGEEKMLHSIRIGLTPFVTLRSDLKSILPRLLEGDSINRQINDHNNNIIFGSLQRVVSFVEDLLKSYGKVA